MIRKYAEFTKANGYFVNNRDQQKKRWLEESLENHFRQLQQGDVLALKKEKLLKGVMDEKLLPTEAARKFWEEILGN